MPRSYQQVNLHRARFSQLAQIAAALGTSISSALEGLISSAVERGVIPDVLDGIGIARQGEHVALTIAGQALPALSIPEARTLASRLGGFVSRTIEGSSTAHKLSDGTEIAIRRAGRGFCLASGTARIIITAGMAGDITRQIRKAAA